MSRLKYVDDVLNYALAFAFLAGMCTQFFPLLARDGWLALLFALLPFYGVFSITFSASKQQGVSVGRHEILEESRENMCLPFRRTV